MLKDEGSNPGLAVSFLIRNTQLKVGSLIRTMSYAVAIRLLKNHKPRFLVEAEAESSEVDRWNYLQHGFPIL